MILIIDNYDSFTYNLVQMVGEMEPDLQVIRNDAMTIDQIRSLDPAGIILSPGPGRPEDAGICPDVIKELGRDIPILGICLGHQAIFQAFGGTVDHAPSLMHGKQSITTLDENCPLFEGITSPIPVARYHSLSADESTLPNELKLIARSDDGVIMAVQHKEYPVYGLQFHPESILTPDGKIILENCLAICRKYKENKEGK